MAQVSKATGVPERLSARGATGRTMNDADRGDEAPTVEEVLRDEIHGSSWLSLRALDALRDAARDAAENDGDWGDVASAARRLREGRPEMAVLRNRVDRAMHRADRDPASIARAAEAVREEAAGADDEAAALAAERIGGRRVLVVSRSEPVLAALRRGDPAGVVVAASRPGGEGVAVAGTLAEELDDGIDVALAPDSAVAQALAGGAADAVLLGADRVLPDGSVVNKVGSRAAAVAAAREDRPVWAVTSVDKVDPTGGYEAKPAGELDAPSGVERFDPRLDVTPADAIDAVLTERGALDADAIAAVAEEFAELAAWREEAADGERG